MSFQDFAKSKVEDPLVVVTFDTPSNSDVAVVMCATRDASGAFSGLKFMCVKSNGTVYRVKRDVVDVFKPRLSSRPGDAAMYISIHPLTKEVKVVERKGGFVCLYPLDPTRRGTIVSLHVDDAGSTAELFTTYKGKGLPKENVSVYLTASQEFVARLKKVMD